MAFDPAPGATSQLPPIGEHKVGTLELFFDLIFVFALTQVTYLMAEEGTWTNLVRGLAVLAVMWWVWVGYSWMTNYTNPDDGWTRLSIFGSMCAALVVSLAIPHAFSQWDVQFAAGYLVLALLFALTYAAAARGDRGVLVSIAKLSVGVVGAPALILVASFQDAGLLRAALWASAIVLAYAAGYLSGEEGWRLDPGHFAERHGLIIIIALGEAIVSIGVGAGTGEHGLSTGVIVAALLAMVIACTLWWLYFDVGALVVERRLAATRGQAQIAMARDSYSYLHYLLVAGIVLTALGVKKVLIYLDKPLAVEWRTALLGGAALYLLGHVLIRLRNIHSIALRRAVAAGVLLLLIPLTAHVAAIAVLAGVVVVLVGLVAYETVRFASTRYTVRFAGGIPSPNIR